MKLYKKYKKISPYKKSMLWWNGQEQPVREKGGKKWQRMNVFWRNVRALNMEMMKYGANSYFIVDKSNVIDRSTYMHTN